MLLGVYTGLHEQVSVYDFGLDNHTAADGLAVGRPSGFVGRAMQRLIDGYYTVSDAELFRLLALVEKLEGLALEPSALAGVPGMGRVLQENQGYRQRLGLDERRMANATHLVWATGGSMVPREEMDAYGKGRAIVHGRQGLSPAAKRPGQSARACKCHWPSVSRARPLAGSRASRRSCRAVSVNVLTVARSSAPVSGRSFLV